MINARIKNLIFLCSLLVLVSCGGTGAEKGTGETVTLKFNPELGKQYSAEMDVTAETKMMGINIPVNIKVQYSMVPTEVNDSFSVLKVTYDRIYMKMENPMSGAVEYDSDSANQAKGLGADKIKEVYGNMVGSTFTAKFDQLGNAISIESDIADLKQTMGAFSNATDMEQYLENMVATFPGKPIAKGDSWESTTTEGGSSEMKVFKKYTVKKVTANTVELAVEGNVNPPAENDTTGRDIKIEGTLTGDLSIDRQTGWTNDGSLTQNLTMTINRGMKTITSTSKNQIDILIK